MLFNIYMYIIFLLLESWCDLMYSQTHLFELQGSCFWDFLTLTTKTLPQIVNINQSHDNRVQEELWRQTYLEKYICSDNVAFTDWWSFLKYPGKRTVFIKVFNFLQPSKASCGLWSVEITLSLWERLLVAHRLNFLRSFSFYIPEWLKEKMMWTFWNIMFFLQ